MDIAFLDCFNTESNLLTNNFVYDHSRKVEFLHVRISLISLILTPLSVPKFSIGN